MILKGNWSTRQVWLDGKKLDPRPSQKLWNHSPDGFNWGYGGSGPAQLALAICMKFMPGSQAVERHQAFKRELIAALPQADFEVELTLEQVKGVDQNDLRNGRD
jgi:hypothetical protein